MSDATQSSDAAPGSVPKVENLATARFECVYPSCGGICCTNGRPAVEASEERSIRFHLLKFLDRLRPAARARIERHGFLDTRVTTNGRPTLAVVNGWCVFFKDGCVLHQVGAEEGDKFRYKPWRCALFPLKQSRDGTWHVRQRGERGESWDLFCLNPEESSQRAGATLKEEVAHLERLARERRMTES